MKKSILTASFVLGVMWFSTLGLLPTTIMTDPTGAEPVAEATLTNDQQAPVLSDSMEETLSRLRDQVTLKGDNGEPLTPTETDSSTNLNVKGWEKVDTITQVTNQPSAELSPPPRYGFAMMYFYGTNYVVMFGGVGAGYQIYGDTWHYYFEQDKLYWEIQDLQVAPSPRIWPALTFVAGIPDKLVLFGGQTKNSYLSDTWVYLDGSGWEQETTINTPEARSKATMIPSPINQAAVMVGGVTHLTCYTQNLRPYPCTRLTYFNDFWEYTPSNDTVNHGVWTKYNQSEYAFSVGGSQVSLAYDPNTDKIFAFGGASPYSNYATKYWDYGSNSWTRVDTTGHPPNTWGSGMVYDPQLQLLVLFGGYSGNDVPYQEQSSTWVFNTTASTWTQLSLDLAPYPRDAHTMQYIDATSEILVFGGGGFYYDQSYNNIVKRFNDTWVFNSDPKTLSRAQVSNQAMVGLAEGVLGNNIISDKWEQKTPAVAPSARVEFDLVYVPGTNKAVLFGGEVHGSIYYNDTWVYDFDTEAWVEKNPALVPPARSYQSMVYDPSSGKVVMFGGKGYYGEYNDTWLYDLNTNTWTEVEASGDITARLATAMVYNTQREKVVLVGGLSYALGTYHTEFWEFDTQTSSWTNLTQTNTGTGPVGVGFEVVYDQKNDLIISYGGFDGDHHGKTYVWDYGTMSWKDLAVTNQPPAMAWFGMVYDPKSTLTIVFGGFNGDTSTYSNSTWSFNSTSNVWTELDLNHSLTARISRIMAMNTDTSSVLLFGGSDEVNDHSDTWLLNVSYLIPTGPDPTTTVMSSETTSSTSQTTTAGGVELFFALLLSLSVISVMKHSRKLRLKK